MTGNILICPVCGSELHREEKSLFCGAAKRHCFDISASGHINLCVGRATGGDSKEAVRSRTDFLKLGHYKPISDKICEIIMQIKPESTVIDAGCGEGYYTNNIARMTGFDVYGFDLSKEAIISASKSARREGLENSTFCVGGIYKIPVKDACADVITNIFAPCAEDEFLRLLKPEGTLIVVSSGKNHLLGLKRAIYENVYTNEERADLPKKMRLEARLELEYKITLDRSEDIRNLFSMTPYSYRTSEKDYKKLLELDHLETEVDVEIAVYRKGSD